MNSFESHGRERNLEDIADEIMNQSDEGLDDLLDGTALDSDADLSGFDDVDGEEFFDDGGDYVDF